MATIPTTYSWTVGELVTASKLNTYLRDSVSFLLARPYVRLFNSVDQVISTSTATALTMDSEADDTDGSHSTTTNPSRITVQTAGVWTFTVDAGWVANSAGKRECYLRRNGTTIFGGSAFPAVQAVALSHSVTASFRCSVGDYVEAVVWQNSGGDLNISGTFHGGQRLTGIWERT